MQDLNTKYQTTKAEIQAVLQSLKNILSNQQYQEIKKSLEDRYKSAITTAISRATGRYTTRVAHPDQTNPGQAGEAEANNPKGDPKIFQEQRLDS